MDKQLIRIQEFGDFEGKLAEFRERYDNVVYDLEDPRQNKQARSDKFAIGKVVGNLDRAHKKLKAPLLEQVRLVDGERKRIKDELLGIQGRVKGQLEQYEAKIKAAEEAVQKRIDAILALAEFEEPPQSGLIRSRLAAWETVNPEDTEYAPRQADAALASRQVGRALNEMLAKRVAYEKEQAELARLRAEKEARERQDREDRIRREAEEKAKREAEALARGKAEEAKRREQAIREEKERAEAAARQAEERGKAQAAAAAKREKELKERAARDKADAEKRAQQAAKEAAERAAQAERDRLLAEQHKREAAELKAKEVAERRAAQQSHRDRINKEIKEQMVSLGIDGDVAMTIIDAVNNGAISHMMVIY